MLFKHGNRKTGARQEKAKHHAGWTSADNTGCLHEPL
jgi:hypothetical protein